MKLEYIGLSELSGSLIVLEGVRGAAYDEMAEITLDSGEQRWGRVILIDGDRVVLQADVGDHPFLEEDLERLLETLDQTREV